MSADLEKTLLRALHNTADVFCQELKAKKPIFIRLFSLDVPPLVHLKPRVRFYNGVSTDTHLAITYHGDIVNSETGSPIALYVSQLYKLLSERLTLIPTLDSLNNGFDIGLLMRDIRDNHRPLFDEIINGNRELEIQWCALFDRRENHDTYKEVPRVNDNFKNIPSMPLIDWNWFTDIVDLSYCYDPGDKTIELLTCTRNPGSEEKHACVNVLAFCRKFIHLLEGMYFGECSPARLHNKLIDAKTAHGTSLAFPYVIEHFHPDTAERFFSDWYTKFDPLQLRRIVLTGDTLPLMSDEENRLFSGFINDLQTVAEMYLGEPRSAALPGSAVKAIGQRLEALGNLPDRDYTFAAMFGFKTFFVDQPQETAVTTQTFVPLDEDNSRTTGKVLTSEGEQVLRASFDSDGRMSVVSEISPIDKVLGSYGITDVKQNIDYSAIVNNRADVLLFRFTNLTTMNIPFPNNIENPSAKMASVSQIRRLENMRLAYHSDEISAFIITEIGAFWSYVKSVDVPLDLLSVTAIRLFLIYRDWILYQFINKTFDSNDPDVTIEKIASFV